MLFRARVLQKEYNMKYKKIKYWLIFSIAIFISLPLTSKAALNNYWPMQLGNWWTYEITEFDYSKFNLWKANFQGSGTSSIKNTCTSANEPVNLLGSKIALTVVPNPGYNRFNTTRYVQFFKEDGAAYHGPVFCQPPADNPNSWNLHWYMHNPVYYNGNYWLGSEGGVRFSRSALNGENLSAGDPLLERYSSISSFGKFPKELRFHSGAGRTPQYGTNSLGLPGYTYLPLENVPDVSNINQRVNSDFRYDFGMGWNPAWTISNPIDFRIMTNTYSNDWTEDNKMTWEMEFIPLKARDVLIKNVIPQDTDVMSVVIFEPYYRTAQSIGSNSEIACENWYFAENIGLVKLSETIVAVLPDDPDLEKTKQLCFYQFKTNFESSQNLNDHGIIFSDLEPYMQDINLMKYSYPINSFEITGYEIKNNPSTDELGFHSPDAASLNDFPESNSIEYFSNGRWWVFKQNGEIWSEGNLYDTWRNSGITGWTGSSGGLIYPWTNNGPDAVENGSDINYLFGAKGIVVNDGVYWFRNSGAAQPFDAPSGYLRDLLPGYYQLFGDNTDRLGIAVTGNNEIFIEKDGTYLYYGKDGSGNIYLKLNGRNADLSGWQQAPAISGTRPFSPDTMMYGAVFNQDYNSSARADQSPISSTNQLIIFQGGRAWVKYGYTGSWETWRGHLKSGYSIQDNPPDTIPPAAPQGLSVQ